MKAADLRKSILQAAVQGKLVPQDKNDEPASELLKRIQAEKTTLIKASKLKKEKPLPPITENEIPYDLPEGWVWCRLTETAQIINGDRGKNYPSKEKLTTLGIPFISAINIENGSISTNKLLCVSQKQYDALGNGKLQKDDIVFCIRGSLGKCGIFPFEKGAIASSLVIIRDYLTEGKILQYLFLYLNSPLLLGEIKEHDNGTAQPNLSAGNLNQFLFPLPPYTEQKRIVAKVDKLMALCDELEAAEKELDALEIHLDDNLPKSILQAAVKGKLVPQDKNDEPASELLKRIQAEKTALTKAGKLKKGKPLPPITEDEVPYDLPEGWVWCRIGDIAITNPRNTLPDGMKVSFLSMSLISQEYFGGHQQEIKLWKDVKNGFTHFSEGDVLLAKITPCFQNGKSCIAHNLHSGYGAGTTELHVLRSILIDSHYLLLFLKNPTFITEAEKNMTGTAGQQRVPTEYLRQFPFPLPPRAEQQRIIAKVDELMTLCEELKHVDDRPNDHSNVMPFPITAGANSEPIEMAARGEANNLSARAKQAIEDLFAEDE